MIILVAFDSSYEFDNSTYLAPGHKMSAALETILEGSSVTCKSSIVKALLTAAHPIIFKKRRSIESDGYTSDVSVLYTSLSIHVQYKS